MAQKKNKYYVVWKGEQPGIYLNWADCKAQVSGHAGAKYKAFDSEEEAKEALAAGYTNYLQKVSSPKAIAKWKPETAVGNPIPESLAVDAACSGNPGDMEYRGVYTANGQEIFHIGPLKEGTNNIGEFLALVHGLALLKQKGSDLPLLTETAANKPIFDLIQRAEHWLQNNTYTTQILKWETSVWGEIPADFGRK